MCLKNYSNLYKTVFSYLRMSYDESYLKIIDECFKELDKVIQFKSLNVEFDYLIKELDKSPYKEFLEGSSGYYLTSYTLGIGVENLIKSYRFKDLTKMLIMDACASTYLEYLSDLYDKSLYDNLSYRFCPGYQGSNVSDLKELKKYLNIQKIGIDLLDSNIMVPQKSMIGILAKDKTIKKTCGACMLKGKCEFIKENKRCYD